MPVLIQGVGTTFYGKRDFRADGTYVTTEWAVLFHIPLLPVRSLRVKYLGVGRSPTEPGLKPAPQYHICEETNPNWKQVLYVYVYVAFIPTWLTFYANHWEKALIGIDERLGAVLLLLGLLWPAFVPAIMRFVARTRARA